jgi:hypothetical protein
MVLKNIDPISKQLLSNLDSIRGWFNKTFFVFVNFNSIDNTYTLFKDIPNSLLFNTSADEEYKVRNIYLKFVHENKEAFDYMMVIDPFTSLVMPLKKDSFNCMLSHNVSSWDAVFANQSYKYYDIPNLVTESIDITNILAGNVDTFIKKEQKHIPSNMGLIPVKSAFGGFAIYKTYILDSSNKYTRDGHVSFNLNLLNAQNSNTMFIDSSFVIETSPSMAELYL